MDNFIYSHLMQFIKLLEMNLLFLFVSEHFFVYICSNLRQIILDNKIRKTE